MPGIEDIQPKQLSSLGQPMVSEFKPAVTQDAVQKLIDGFRSGQIHASDIMQRNQTLAKGDLEISLLRQQSSPEAVAAREQTAKLAAEKALAERETMLTKDFVAAYMRYNLPLKKEDGTPDYSGMAEVGQKYADTERLLKYSEIGVTPAGPPVETIDNNGVKHVATYNAFGEDITQVPGKRNMILEEHQKNLRKSRAFLLQNDKEPDIPEGETRKIEVSPKTATPLPATPPSFPMRTFVTPGPVEYVPPPEPRAPVAPVAPVVPKPTAPQVAQPAELPIYQSGEGRVVGLDFKPDELVKDMRSQELYKNWAEKSATIERFRQVAYSYDPKEKVTAQKDIALASAITQMMTPSASGGARGMQEMRPKALEEAEYLLYRVKDLPGHLLKADYFSPETRQLLITEGERAAKALESVARGPVQNTVDRLQKVGKDPAQYLTGAEMQLIKGGPTPPAGGPSAGGTTTVPVTLSSGRTAYMTVRRQ